MGYNVNMRKLSRKEIGGFVLPFVVGIVVCLAGRESMHLQVNMSGPESGETRNPPSLPGIIELTPTSGPIRTLPPTFQTTPTFEPVTITVPSTTPAENIQPTLPASTGTKATQATVTTTFPSPAAQPSMTPVVITPEPPEYSSDPSNHTATPTATLDLPPTIDLTATATPDIPPTPDLPATATPDIPPTPDLPPTPTPDLPPTPDATPTPDLPEGQNVGYSVNPIPFKTFPISPAPTRRP